jgi:PAS domain S-box-containing protein
MTLRKKNILAISIIFLVFVVFFGCLINYMLLKEFNLAEAMIAEQKIVQAINSLNDSLEKFRVTADDYAIWDDTYEFVNGNMPNFIEENLGDNGFINLRLNFLVVADNAGKIIFERAFDLAGRKEMEIPGEFNQYLNLNSQVFYHPDSKSGTKGIVMISGKPVMFISRPILRTDGGGSSAGSYIIGRYLEGDELKRISDQTSAEIKIISPAKDNIYNSFSGELISPDGSAVEVKINDKKLVLAAAPVKDVDGRTAFYFLNSNSGKIIAGGKKTLFNLNIIIIISGLAISTLFYLLFSRPIILKLEKMLGWIREVRKTGNYSSMAFAGGDDETEMIGAEIKAAFEEFNEKKAETAENEKRMRQILELARIWTWELDQEGNYIYSNKQSEGVIGYRREEIVGRNIAYFFNPDEKDKFAAEIKSKIDNKRPFRDFINSKISKAGKVLWFSCGAAPNFDDSGKFTGFIGYSFDITEEKLSKDNYEKNNLEIGQFNQLVADREMKMIELKKRIKELEAEKHN